jgi:Protein of unknown function (DUF3723)
MSSPDNERRLFESKRAHFKGSAKVPLDLLQSYAPSTFTFDAKNVARLIKIFEQEGCYRLNPDHHVPVTISRQSFEQALRDAGIDQHTLLTNDDPPLIQPEGVTVLHGRHRLNAAQTHLYPNEQWWVVDFYDDGECVIARLSILRSLSMQRSAAGSLHGSSGGVCQLSSIL